MALHHAEPGEVIDLASPADDAPDDTSRALFKTDDIEVIRRVLQPGKPIPPHEVDGDLTLQCLQGTVLLDAYGQTRSIPVGHLAYVSACEPYSLSADDEAVVLMTFVRTRENG